MALQNPISRRRFITSSGLLLGATAVPWAALRTVHAASVTPPKLEQGIQIGDVRAHRAVIWSRSDRPARLLVEYDVSEHFVNPTRVRGPFALGTTDFTARVDLTHLPDGR
jgi:alkaline phosphatase D